MASLTLSTTLATTLSSDFGSEATWKTGPITLASVHRSSSCMKLGFSCSDICLSLSASVNALAAGSLPCSLHPEVQPPSALPCHRPSRPTGTRRWRVILATALIRQGGGYNERPASKASLFLGVLRQFA